MKKRMKIFIEAICLISVLILSCGAVHAEDGFAWLEAENGTIVSGKYQAKEVSEASGGAGMMLYADTDIDGEEPARVDLTFTVPADGDYDIKILSTYGTVTYLSKFAWRIDTDAYKNCKDDKSADIYSFATNTAAFTNQNVCWYSLGTKTLTAGEHVFSVYVEEAREINYLYDYMFHYFDVVAIVPTEWGWMPDGIKPPKAPVEGKLKPNIVTWVNIKDVAILEGGARVGGSDVVVNSVLEEGTVVTIEIPFKAPKEGRYDLYFCGIPSGVNYASPYAEYLIDGESKGEPTKSKYYQSGIASAATSSIGAGMQWQKLEQLDLDTEEHTITFVFNEKRSMDNSYIVSLRYLYLVPTDIKLNVAGKLSYEAIGELLGVNIYMNETEVKEDLMLQTKALDGSVITWSADKPEIITSEGTVNQPGYYEQDTDVVLTAMIEIPYVDSNNQNLIYQYTKSFDLKVLKKNEYSVKDFKLSYPNGAFFGENEEGNQVLKASAKVSNNTTEEKQAMLVLALYDENGKMVAVKSDIIDADAELKPLSAELLIEEEQVGYTAEAFIWTDMKTRDLVENAILSYSKTQR